MSYSDPATASRRRSASEGLNFCIILGDDSNMLPTLVTPLHDLGGSILQHLELIEPVLKQVFLNAVMSVTQATIRGNPAQVDRLRADPFYKLFPVAAKQVGDQFADLYWQAVSVSQSGQILDLCFLDRLAFILQSDHKVAFLQDIHSLDPAESALLFSRSERAWATHPTNYRQIEQFATQIGEFLFGKYLDFAWCHLKVRSGRLEKVLDQVHNPDLSVLAEIMLGLMDAIRMKAVDWLAWEDPFLLGRDQEELKRERENSRAETERRLATCLSTIQTLTRYQGPGNVEN